MQTLEPQGFDYDGGHSGHFLKIMCPPCEPYACKGFRLGGHGGHIILHTVGRISLSFVIPIAIIKHGDCLTDCFYILVCKKECPPCPPCLLNLRATRVCMVDTFLNHIKKTTQKWFNTSLLHVLTRDIVDFSDC